MKTSREKKGESRHGKHDPDSVLLGMHAKPELKALAHLVLAKDNQCKDISDVIRRGIEELAIRNKIMDKTGIKPEYIHERDLIAAMIRDSKKQNQKKAKERSEAGKDR